MNKTSDRILVLKGQSQYDVLRVFADNMIKAFEDLGQTVDIIDFQKNNYSEDLIDSIIYQERYQYKFVFAFNAIAIDYILKNKEYLFDNCGTIFYGFLVDHPLFHHVRLLSKRENVIISCVDKNHIPYIEKHYRNIKKVEFMPHAADKSLNSNINITDRGIDMSFFGSYSKADLIKEEFNKFAPVISGMLREISSKMITNSVLTLEVALEEYLIKNNVKISSEEFREIMSNINCVDLYVRSYFREKIIKVLIENNIKVHVYGNGWNMFDSSGIENLVIHEQLNYIEVLEIMSRSKIILNILPSFKNGSHERLFSSMLEGAVCLTNDNKYIKNNFENGRDIILYSLEELDELPSIVNNVLDNKEKLNCISQKGKQKATLEHLWKNRAKLILEQVENYSSERG